MKTRTFTDEVYGSHFVLMWGATPEQFAERIWRDYDKSYDGDADFLGRCFDTNEPPVHTVIILLPEWRRSTGMPVLVHELLHATARVLRYRGIEFSEETEECYAYMLDSLTRRCLEFLP